MKCFRPQSLGVVLAVSSFLLTATVIPTLSPVYAAESNPSAQNDPASESAAEHSVLYVNPDQGADSPSNGATQATPFKSITFALQQAKTGTVIQLAPGAYGPAETFPLQLKQGVTLQGDPTHKGQGVIINGGAMTPTPSSSRQNVAIMAASGSQIKGVTITNANNRGTGIWVESSNVTISYNTFTNNGREGVVVAGRGAPTIEHSRFQKNQGNGITLMDQAAGRIGNNHFEDTGYGISISGDAAPTLTANTIRLNRSGIVIVDAAQPTLSGNVVEDNREYGLVCTGRNKPVDQGQNIFRRNGQDILVQYVSSSPPMPDDGPVRTVPASQPSVSSAPSPNPPAESQAPRPSGSAKLEILW